MVEPTATLESSAKQKRHSFRWRLIPVALLLIFGAIEILAGILMSFGAVYVNLRYGWVDPRLNEPTLNQVAITFSNLTFWQSTFWCGVVALGAAFAWLRGCWSIAWSTTGLVWLLMGLQVALQPPHQ